MKRFDARILGVDQGRILLFSDFEEGGPMWTGEGPRLVRRDVTFSEPFREPPQVIVSLEMWDIDQASNQRADLVAENVTRTGCEILFKTWGDTRVARIRAGWTAIGPLRYDDDWDLN